MSGEEVVFNKVSVLIICTHIITVARPVTWVSSAHNTSFAILNIINIILIWVVERSWMYNATIREITVASAQKIELKTN